MARFDDVDISDLQGPPPGRRAPSAPGEAVPGPDARKSPAGRAGAPGGGKGAGRRGKQPREAEGRGKAVIRVTVELPASAHLVLKLAAQSQDTSLRGLLAEMAVREAAALGPTVQALLADAMGMAGK